MSVFDVFLERGFIAEMTHPEEIRHILGNERITCYIGFDPTASSLHVGSLVPIMALAHMQKNGHMPIALMGGGTGLVGDPSGKTEMRKLITVDDVNENIKGIRKQLECFINFQAGQAILVNNADWLLKVGYINFLRDIGRHFSVNRMLKAESYRMRLDSEDGLNFIEFNYMLLQAFDFLQLFDDHHCLLQMGGSDQWGNIVAGIDLVRRLRNQQVYGLTFPLITTSSGAKMGKTAAGAVWLDASRTSPYEYYQYWINTDDKDVVRFLALFTFLPMDEIKKVEMLDGSDLNTAKGVLAFEITRLAHGEEEAVRAYRDSVVHFGARELPSHVLPSSILHEVNVGHKAGGDNGGLAPQSEIALSRLAQGDGLPAVEIFHATGLAESKGAARRLIHQGGGYVNGRRIDSPDFRITAADVKDMKVVLRAGKKKYHTLVVR